MMTATEPTPVDHTLPDGWQRVCLGEVADVAFSGVDKRTVRLDQSRAVPLALVFQHRCKKG